METITNIIAANLAYLRHSNGLTQQELAQKINYSDNAVSRWERGEATPSIETLEVIAAFYDIPISDLLKENLRDRDKAPTTKDLVQSILLIVFSASVVWTLAAIVFLYARMFDSPLPFFGKSRWLIFVFSVPLSMMVLYFFNKRMWRNKLLNFIFHTIFWWSLLAAIYLLLYFQHNLNFWLIFFLGIPIELAQVLWYLSKR